MAKKSPKRNIIIASLIVIASFITIGVSSYVIKLDTFNSITNSNNDPIDYDDLVEVKIGYKWYADYSETKEDPTQVGNGTYGTFTYANGEFSNIGYITISDVDSYDTINNFYQTYSGEKTDLNNGTKYTFTSVESDTNLGINKDTSLITIQCKDGAPIKAESNCTGTDYSGSYFVYKEEITKSFTSESNSDFEDSSSIETFYVPKNSILQDNIINAYTDNIYENKTYSFNKFVKVEEDGQETEFDWKNTKIVEPINLYAVYNTSNTTSPLYSSITKTINDASTNGNADSLKIYAGAGDMNYNVTSDLTYFSLDKSFSLGDKNTITNISEGDTVNFCLNNGEISIENTTDAGKQRVEPDTQYLQYKIILQNDLNIDGTMTIGSRYGSWKNVNQNGNIADVYVWLDLNGHNINIGSKGRLENYGLITDSKKTGCVNVNGGELLTMTVIQDYKGGNATSECKNQQTFPFVLYSIPYLRCKTRFYFNNNTFGKLYGFVNILAATTIFDQHDNVIINFIGDNTGEYFFGIANKSNNEKNDAYVELDVKKNKLIEQEISNYRESGMYLHCLDYRNIWTFNNLDFQFYPLELEVVTVTINTKEFRFPISPFFDINIIGCKILFSQELLFLPGSSFILDEDSQLIFEVNQNDNNYAASIFVFDKPFYYYDSTKSIYITNTFPKAPSTGSDFYNSNVYWKYYSSPIVYNYGQTLFRTNNVKEYSLAGLFNFNEIGYIDENNNFTLLDDSGNKTIFEKLNDNNTIVETTNYDYIRTDDWSIRTSGTPEGINGRAYALPLISYNNAYFKYNNQFYKGSWDNENYLINCDNTTYFCYLNPLEPSSSKSSLNDRSIEIQILSNYDYSYKILTYDNEKYALFGGLFLKIHNETSQTQLQLNMSRIYYRYNDDNASYKTVYFNSNGYWHI